MTMRYIWLTSLIFTHVLAQDPTTTIPQWNGDPKICTIDSSSISDVPPMPRFPEKAEFTLERVEMQHYGDFNPPAQQTLFEYIYDFVSNMLIVVKNDNNIKEVNYFYYGSLKKFTYYRDQFCIVNKIPTNVDSDGNSAIQLSDGTWHVRPLNELLLFSSSDPNRTIIRPMYIGQSLVRGIPVDQWQICLVDRTKYRTELRTWSFAQSNVNMPFGNVGSRAAPIQLILNASYSLNGTQIVEVDEVFNIISYRPGIIEDTSSLSPPKGVFCANSSENLVSLNDLNIFWPRRFSVRIDALSSRSSTWQSFHLQVLNTQTSKRIRYDYLPTGGQNFKTVILDYEDDLTYSIDRRSGSCNIIRGTQFPDVNPLTKSIEFFIKHENRFIDQPNEKVWQFNGFRRCRGNAIMCTIVTTSLEQFPPIIDSDTDRPTGEVWTATNIEYAWSARSPSSTEKIFDYPVHLFMRMQRYDGVAVFKDPNIQTEDVQYEFYEMSYDVHLNNFDTSICYRSLDLPYRQFGFILDIVSGDSVDNNRVDRSRLETKLLSNLVNGSEVSETRISKLELEHIRYENAFYVLFTLLGEPVDTEDEPSIEAAEVNLRKFINNGFLNFNTPFSSNSSNEVQLRAQANSLKSFEQFVSIHAGTSYANLSNCSDTTMTTMTTMTTTTTATVTTTTTTVTTAGTGTISTLTSTMANCTVTPVNNFNYSIERIIEEKYSVSAGAGGIVGGMVVGIVVGLMIMLAIGFLRRNSTTQSTNARTSFENPRGASSIQMADLSRSVDATDT